MCVRACACSRTYISSLMVWRLDIIVKDTVLCFFEISYLVYPDKILLFFCDITYIAIHVSKSVWTSFTNIFTEDEVPLLCYGLNLVKLALSPTRHLCWFFNKVGGYFSGRLDVSLINVRVFVTTIEISVLHSDDR